MFLLGCGLRLWGAAQIPVANKIQYFKLNQSLKVAPWPPASSLISPLLHHLNSSVSYCSATDVSIGTRLLAGCTTGAMAVTFAQPTDVVKVRFQAQVRLPDSGGVKRYSSTMEAYRTIARDEGVKGLWKGQDLGKQVLKYLHILLLNPCI